MPQFSANLSMLFPERPFLQRFAAAAQAGFSAVEFMFPYAFTIADLRDAIARNGHATLHLDLVPGRTLERLRQDLEKPRNSRSLGEHLRRQTGIDGAKVALLHEVLDKPALQDTARIAATLKRLPLRLLRPRPMAETISTAGGVRLEAMDDALMLRDAPGVFCAGEMLDWEAPTGGYLLTACFASGRQAAQGVVDWLAQRDA